MPTIEITTAPRTEGSGYPPPFDEPCRSRTRQHLGDAAGLTQFGVNLLTLPPGSWSSRRHWESAEDEFVWVLEGEVVLVTDAGEALLRAGDCAGFAAGVADGHHLQNRSSQPARVLEVGSRHPDTNWTEYPGIDLRWSPTDGAIHRDGTPYK